MDLDGFEEWIFHELSRTFVSPRIMRSRQDAGDYFIQQSAMPKSDMVEMHAEMESSLARAF